MQFVLTREYEALKQQVEVLRMMIDAQKKDLQSFHSRNSTLENQNRDLNERLSRIGNLNKAITPLNIIYSPNGWKRISTTDEILIERHVKTFGPWTFAMHNDKNYV
jgi:type II secretory pathway pseudopilin PulG